MTKPKPRTCIYNENGACAQTSKACEYTKKTETKCDAYTNANPEPAYEHKAKPASNPKTKTTPEPEAGETKLCRKCGRTLPVSKFWKMSASKDGYQHWCKDCQLYVDEVIESQ